MVLCDMGAGVKSKVVEALRELALADDVLRRPSLPGIEECVAIADDARMANWP